MFLEEDEPDIIFGDEDSEELAPFASPIEEQFPVFTAERKKAEDNSPKTRLVRVDTDRSYKGLISEHSARELGRRVNELRDALEAHESDHHGGQHKPLSKWTEIIGEAAQAVTDLSAAKTHGEAHEKLPAVPLDLPADDARNVKCWKDGRHVILSIRFGTPSGTRIATSATRPVVNGEQVARDAIRQGVDPIIVLGALPELADMAAGKRLLRDVAGAALNAQRRFDVCGMSDEDEPVLLVSRGEEEKAPAKALAATMQRAQCGDEQACLELNTIQAALKSASPRARAAAKPAIDEAAFLAKESWSS